MMITSYCIYLVMLPSDVMIMFMFVRWLSSLKTSSGAIEDTMPQADDFFRIVWESFILYKLCLQFRAVSGNIVFMYKVLNSI
jgi:hypothetical protein